MSNEHRPVETIAVIGAGEMGAAVGRRMREAGARVLTTLAGRGTASARRVAEAGIEVVDDDERLVGEATFVLSIVPPGQAVHVAERFCAPLSRAAHKPVFAECNAVAPVTVRRIAVMLAPSGCRFIDAGIIGGPPPAGRLDKGPRFYASGPDAHLLARLRAFGLDIATLDGPIGAASALKLSYAGLTKGITALGAAMVAAASREGLDGALRAELARSQPEILARIERGLPAMFPKAYRWVAEMEEISSFVGSVNGGAEIYSGAARLYAQIAADLDAEAAQPTLLAALQSFLRIRNSGDL
jgi:3-hydroxyisobutyrate dehydrogenase-like beta-hydroxyacid dehydrogenase